MYGVHLFGFLGLVYVTSSEVLLKVDAGTGISFIDLWNLHNTSTGTESGNIYRNGILDNGFSQNCPSDIYIVLSTTGVNNPYSIRYNGLFSYTALEAWIGATPIFIAHTAPVADANMTLSPGSDLIFTISSVTDPAKFYLVVLYGDNTGAYPKYYHTNDQYPKYGPIPGSESNFRAEDYLMIRAKYDDPGCDLVDRNTNVPVEEVIRQLKSGAETTKELITTTSVAETTTQSTAAIDETTTQSATSGAGTTSQSATSGDGTATQSMTSGTGTTTQSATSRAETTTQLATSGTDAASTGQTVTGTTSENEMCPCDCEFKKRLDTLSAVSDIPIEELKIQLAPEIQAIKENLTVDAASLSATLRKLTSASDSRPSAEQIGVVGAVLLGFVFGMLLLIDITSIPRHIMLAKRNCFGNK